MSVTAPPDCEFLEWDSNFFGCRIGRLSTATLTPEGVAAAISWSVEERIDCLYLLADPNDRATVVLAESAGFSLVDVRVTLSTKSDPIPKPASSSISIRPARAEDVPTLCAVARRSHTTTRFYFDRNFPEERCDALYECWIEQSCCGWADQVLVPVVEGKPGGYITCHLEGERGRIGLVAVAETHRGRGLGILLTLSALEWFRSRGVNEVSVVAQGRNTAALRTYERCGFGVESLLLSYHRWSPRRPRP